MAQTRSPASITAQPQAEQAQLPPPDVEEALARGATLLSDGRVLEVSRLLDRWRSRSFVLLVVGEFKRGKSTLLNALIGQDLLPTGVVPVTTVVTRIRTGPRPRALARFQDGTEREVPLDHVRDYVDESRNPDNHRGVASVDIEVTVGPPPGVMLVDVPGLGSTHKHNTDAALAALPEADAVLTFGSISALYGLTHAIIDQTQYSCLIAAVIGSAVLPTLVANAFFLPRYLLPKQPATREPAGTSSPGLAEEATR